MADKAKEEVSRRGFFGAAGKGAAVGLGAVVAATSGARAEEAEAVDGGHYRKSDHVKTFYATARF